MVDYANPLTATFELQRQTITQSQEALSQGVEFQQRFSEAFDALAEELEAGTDTYDELALDYLDTVDDQIGMLVEAHAELETRSIETTEPITEQFEQLQTQVEEVQKQVCEIQEQTVDAADS
jgi:archaellum component FlaC